jgi:hypothetical protein
MDQRRGRSTPDIEEYRHLVELADEARRAFDELLLAAGAGQVDLAALEMARARAEDLERLRARAARRLAAAHRRAAMHEGLPMASLSTTARPGEAIGGHVDAVARRDQVGAALDLLGAPTRTAELAAAVAALDGPYLSPAELTQLRREEQRQWDRALKTDSAALLRPWYVTPALSAETLAAAPGTYTLSSWVLIERLITPVAPRLWAARATANVARSAAAAPEREEALRPLLARLARGTPWGHAVWAETTDLLDIASEAAQDAERLGDRHAMLAAEAVDRAASLGEQDRAVVLWGLPRPKAAEGPR